MGGWGGERVVDARVRIGRGRVGIRGEGYPVATRNARRGCGHAVSRAHGGEEQRAHGGG